MQKTGIITPFGMYEFLRMPFGLGNATTATRYSVLWIRSFCFFYVHDILIFSRDLSSHVDNLCEVLLLCPKHGLMIGLPKCEFAMSKIEFLGHLLSASGYSPLKKHSAAILPFLPRPTSQLSRGSWE